MKFSWLVDVEAKSHRDNAKYERKESSKHLKGYRMLYNSIVYCCWFSIRKVKLCLSCTKFIQMHHGGKFKCTLCTDLGKDVYLERIKSKWFYLEDYFVTYEMQKYEDENCARPERVAEYIIQCKFSAFHVISYIHSIKATKRKTSICVSPKILLLFGWFTAP